MLARKQMKALVKHLKVKTNRIAADEAAPNILSRIFGTCYKIDQLPFWSVD
jgi:ribosome recycling factor